MRTQLNEKQRVELRRISKIVRRRLAHVMKKRAPIAGKAPPITLLALRSYVLGASDIPLCHLSAILEFYGCTPDELSEWSSKISLLTVNALKLP